MNAFVRVLLAAAVTNAPAIAWALPPCNVQQQVVIRKQQAVVVTPQQQYFGQQIYTTPLYPQQLYLNQIAPHTYFGVGLEVQLDAIAEKISKKVEAQLRAKLRAEQAPQEHPGAALLSAKCASCHHEGTKAVVEKGAPVLFDASDKWIGTRDQAIASKSQIKTGGMPPPPAKEMTDEELLTAKTYLDRVSSRKDD